MSDATPRSAGRPWGFFATLAWFVPIEITRLLVYQYFWIKYQGFLPTVFLPPWSILKAVTWALIASCCATFVVTLAIIRLRRGCTFVSYLALRTPEWRTAIPWVAFGLLASVLVVAILWLLPQDPGANVELTAQSHFLLFCFAYVLFVPLNEEIVFRGFLLTGLRETCFGDSLAIPLTAGLWALAHGLAWQGFAAIFLAGCLLGLMRRSCRSIWPGVGTHAFTNAVAITVQVVIGAAVSPLSN